MPNTTSLEIKNISKSFPGVKALSNINMNIHRGEVHGIMGENGSGKSTLMKIISGIYQYDEGCIFLNGEEIKINTSKEAQQYGISLVQQELSLIPHMTILENIILGREISCGGFLNRGKNRQKVLDILENQLGVYIDYNALALECTPAVQQLASIARALLISPLLLILDEPTSSLDEEEVKNLFQIIMKLKQSGMAIIYISHKMSEIFEICDYVTILRDGKKINSYKSQDITTDILIQDMLGRETPKILSSSNFNHDTHSNPICIMEGVYTKTFGRTALQNISLEIREREILGLGGLLGSGRTEITRALYGLDPLLRGHVFWKGQDMTNEAINIRISHGLGYVPEERRFDGIIANMSVKENISLSILPQISRFGFINFQKEEEIVQKYLKALQIKTPTMNQIVKFLSGGNQQKVILSRWLAMDCQLLIVDEPTRGIDVGAKVEIQNLMKEIVSKGSSICMVSSEIEELIQNSNRIYVVRDGVDIVELKKHDVSESNLLNAFVGKNYHHREDSYE
ncbi:MAG: sugar ABC transporter ATP-binding protein [Brevinema sp.]